MGIQRFAAVELGRIFRGQSVTGLSEWQLLERYLERQDEVAFEALVARHGPMVLGVCRRMLASQTDVEDAFQATFLVLVRRARQLGPRDAIGPWLYGVAARVALRARCEAARRRRFESIHIDAAAAIEERPSAEAELAEVLDQELRRLPSKYRSPIVLCYLEGQTHEEAARVLRWPVGTVKGRLARARDLLRSRLARRGLAPTMLAVTGMLGSEASAAVPSALLECTVRSGLKLAVSQTTAQVASTSIMSLVEGALTAMLLTKIRWIGAALLISALALAGAGVMAQQKKSPLEEKHLRSLEPIVEEAGPNTATATPITAELPTGWSASATSSASAGSPQRNVGSRDLAGHQGRLVELAQGGGGFGGDAGPKPRKPLTAPSPAGHGKDPKSRLILNKLDDLVAMKFPDETPIEDILKHVKENTKSSEMPRGIPIYVDPIGLQEAEKSLTSTVKIDLEGVPLKRTLQLALRQLGLAYLVEDGMIYITTQDSVDQMSHLGPAIPESSPLIEEGERALRGELTVVEMKEWIEKYKTCIKVKSALEPDGAGGEDPEPRGTAMPMTLEIQKLTAVNEELRQKVGKLEGQLIEIRQLLVDLAKQQDLKEKAKKGSGPQ